MATKVIIHTEKQIIETKIYYKVPEETYDKIKNTPVKSKFDILYNWDTFKAIAEDKHIYSEFNIKTGEINK